MAEIIDDKSEHCVPFILQHIQAHQDHFTSIGEKAPPFFVGLNGVQGAGKTTLVETLSRTLSSEPLNLPVAVLSVDDLYLPHQQQQDLAKSHSSNPLVQQRGQASTHDITLGIKLFDDLASRKPNIKIPSYDKSAFSGQGDRRPESEWGTVNRDGQPPVEVIIFEGWCVGFRALTDDELERKWRAAKTEAERGGSYYGQLGRLELNSVKFVNDALRAYDGLTNRLGAFMQIDAEDTRFVYDWRSQQEAALRAAKGTGMSDEQVVKFVNGYYPAYELYTDVLRSGIYPEKGRQLRLVVGKDRKVKEVYTM